MNNINATIIGYWRSGATNLEIAGLTRLPEWWVIKVIEDYKRK